MEDNKDLKSKNPERVKIGKKNKASGRAFELKVRKDLKKHGWTVAKWTNNVELESTQIGLDIINTGKVVPAKHKFNFFTKVMSLGTGFPDFIAYREAPRNNLAQGCIFYEVIGVEAKSNGYLDKDERAKCKWLLQNKIFSKILIASKGEKRGQIEYKEFDRKV